MSKVQNLLRANNPSHRKAILLAGNSYVFDAKHDLLGNTDNGEAIKAGASRIHTEDDDGPARKRDQDRDR